MVSIIFTLIVAVVEFALVSMSGDSPMTWTLSVKPPTLSVKSTFRV
jgi:hypothetical protein